MVAMNGRGMTSKLVEFDTSFTGLQTDKRTLGNKTMIAELKEAAEARRQSPVHCLLLDTAVPRAIRLQPDLVYDMSNPAVHNDVWLVLKAASRIAYSTDLANSIQQFWSNLVAPFFGLDPPESENLIAKEANVNQAMIKIKEANPTPMGTPPPLTATNSPTQDREVAAQRASNGDAAPDAIENAVTTDGSAPMSGAFADGTPIADVSKADAKAARAATSTLNLLIGSAEKLEAVAAVIPSSRVPPLAPVHHAELNDESASPRDIPTAIGGDEATPMHTAEAVASPAPRAPDDIPSEDDEEDFRRSPEDSEEDEEARVSADDDDEEREMYVDTPDRANGSAPAKEPIHSAIHALEFPLAGVDDKVRGATNLWHVAPIQPLCPVEKHIPLPSTLPNGEVAEETDSLYANENLYIFYRLYQHMFDRLRTARTCLKERLEARKGKATDSSNADGAHS